MRKVLTTIEFCKWAMAMRKDYQNAIYINNQDHKPTLLKMNDKKTRCKCVI